MSIEKELAELKRLAAAYIKASEKERKYLAALEYAQANCLDWKAKHTAYLKALMASYDACKELKKAIGTKPIEQRSNNNQR